MITHIHTRRVKLSCALKSYTLYVLHAQSSRRVKLFWTLKNFSSSIDQVWFCTWCKMHTKIIFNNFVHKSLPLVVPLTLVRGLWFSKSQNIKRINNEIKRIRDLELGNEFNKHCQIIYSFKAIDGNGEIIEEIIKKHSPLTVFRSLRYQIPGCHHFPYCAMREFYHRKRMINNLYHEFMKWLHLFNNINI